jgi:hypothetical protein
MSHQFSLGSGHYRTLVQMAAARAQTPEELLARLIDEAWERVCTI